MRTRKCSHSQTCDETSDGDLDYRAHSASLDGGANGEDRRPDEDGTSTTKAVRREGLSEGTNERATHRIQHERLGRKDKSAHPADSREVMMDCRELDRTHVPSDCCSPNRWTKSGIIRHPYAYRVNGSVG